jgi:hypothetical protein
MIFSINRNYTANYRLITTRCTRIYLDLLKDIRRLAQLSESKSYILWAEHVSWVVDLRAIMFEALSNEILNIPLSLHVTTCPGNLASTIHVLNYRFGSDSELEYLA